MPAYPKTQPHANEDYDYYSRNNSREWTPPVVGRPLNLDNPAMQSPVQSVVRGVTKAVQEPARRYVYNHFPYPWEKDIEAEMARLKGLSIKDLASDAWKSTVGNELVGSMVYDDNTSPTGKFLYKRYLDRPLDEEDTAFINRNNIVELLDKTLYSEKPGAFTDASYAIDDDRNRIKSYPLGTSWITDINEEKLNDEYSKYKYTYEDIYDLAPSKYEWARLKDKDKSRYNFPDGSNPYYRDSSLFLRYLMDKAVGNPIKIKGVEYSIRNSGGR